MLSVQPGLRGSNDPRVGWKMATFQLFFQSRERVVVRRSPEIRVGDQDNGSPGRPVSSGLQMPGEPGHFHASTRPPWWPSRVVFPSKCPSITPAEIRNTPRWYFGPLEDNQWGGCCLDPKKIEARTFSGFLNSEFPSQDIRKWVGLRTYQPPLVYRSLEVLETRVSDVISVFMKVSTELSESKLT